MSLISDYHGKATRRRRSDFTRLVSTSARLPEDFRRINRPVLWMAWSFMFLAALAYARLLLNRYLREPERGAADFEESGSSVKPPTEKLTSVNRFGRSGNADRAPSDGGVRLRELRRGRATELDAGVSLSEVPHEPGNVGPHRDPVCSSRQYGGLISGGWMADAWRSVRLAAGSWCRQSAFLRRAVRGAVRPHAVGHDSDRCSHAGASSRACMTRIFSLRYSM